MPMTASFVKRPLSAERALKQKPPWNITMKTLLLLVLTAAAAAQQPPEKKEYGALIKNLASGDRETRLEAINAIADVGPPAAKAVPGLIAILKEKDEELRLSSAIAL